MPETPILDLDQPPPEPPATMVPILIGLAIGAVLAGILILAKMGKMPDWSWPRANGLLLIPALYIVIAFHELGHLIAIWLAWISAGFLSDRSCLPSPEGTGYFDLTAIDGSADSFSHFPRTWICP
jgi:hypothetical protein